MTQTTVPGGDFARDTEPFRSELLAHCYRMLGSVHDAEDQVQETYLRAWKSYDDFEGRSSLRSWLYRIATNVCLTALRSRARRPLPSGLGAPSSPEIPPDAGRADIPWLQPMPDALLDPETVATSREGLRLALVASLQYLAPRQRAVLILRDVLAWPTEEVAVVLGTTVAGVKSALQRARARMAEVAPRVDDVLAPSEPTVRAIVEEYIAAFENADAAGLARLLSRDVVLEMPPSQNWYAGDAVMRRAASVLDRPGRWRMLPTAANGQPAVAMYQSTEAGGHDLFAVVVLAVTPNGISRITTFHDPALFPAFVLPATLG